MPNYVFLNKETNQIEEHRMSYKDLDAFKESNPNLERYFSAENLPQFGDTMRMSVNAGLKPDSTFEKYVIGRMKETIPGNTIGQYHKTKIPREF